MTVKLQSILEAEGLASLLEKFNEQGVTDSIIGDLTDSDLKELGVGKLGERKRLLAAFGKSGVGAPAVSVVEQSLAQTAGGAPSKTAATPGEATKDSPWVNTLGMPFVPIPRFDTRFCIWPVRVQDYEAYCMASGAKFPEIPFPQESDHPIVGVSWNDAIEFCVWLTGKERAEGKIDDKAVYRLPTDLEWSAAVGLPHEPEATPAERHLKAPGYPWGLRWPPPQNAGNYEHTRTNPPHRYEQYREEIASSLADIYNHWKTQWKPIDSYEFTCSVGLFGVNGLGLSDLGGNVWEWCMDELSHAYEFDEKKTILAKILRGGSYALCPDHNLGRFNWVEFDWVPDDDRTTRVIRHRQFHPVDNKAAYRSSFRNCLPPEQWIQDGGFRAVVACC